MKTRFWVAVFSFCLVASASAGVTQKTVYNYFPVKGATASSIYRSITANSEMKGGYETLATTGIQMKTNVLTRKGAGCKVAKADVVMNFKVSVPRLTSESGLPTDLRKDWQGFAAHLKMHEERHRSIWMTCAKRYSASLQLLLNHSCGDLNKVIDKLWSAARNSCQAPNEAWDAKDEKAVARLPFTRRALSGR